MVHITSKCVYLFWANTGGPVFFGLLDLCFRHVCFMLLLKSFFIDVFFGEWFQRRLTVFNLQHLRFVGLVTQPIFDHDQAITIGASWKNGFQLFVPSSLLLLMLFSHFACVNLIIVKLIQKILVTHRFAFWVWWFVSY